MGPQVQTVVRVKVVCVSNRSAGEVEKDGALQLLGQPVRPISKFQVQVQYGTLSQKLRLKKQSRKTVLCFLKPVDKCFKH